MCLRSFSDQAGRGDGSGVPEQTDEEGDASA